MCLFHIFGWINNQIFFLLSKSCLRLQKHPQTIVSLSFEIPIYHLQCSASVHIILRRTTTITCIEMGIINYSTENVGRWIALMLGVPVSWFLGSSGSWNQGGWGSRWWWFSLRLEWRCWKCCYGNYLYIDRGEIQTWCLINLGLYSMLNENDHERRVPF